jgi:hypothetical protein
MTKAKITNQATAKPMHFYFLFSTVSTPFSGKQQQKI